MFTLKQFTRFGEQPCVAPQNVQFFLQLFTRFHFEPILLFFGSAGVGRGLPTIAGVAGITLLLCDRQEHGLHSGVVRLRQWSANAKVSSNTGNRQRTISKRKSFT